MQERDQKILDLFKEAMPTQSVSIGNYLENCYIYNRLNPVHFVAKNPGATSWVDKTFKENEVWYDYGWNAEGNLEVDVPNGDWKHDHLFLEHFMRNAGYEQVEARVYGPPTGGDWYSAVHLFRAPAAVQPVSTVSPQGG